MQKTPPKFVPTLTHIVNPARYSAQAKVDKPADAAVIPFSSVPIAQVIDLEQRILQQVNANVMAQIHTTLERKVREAVASVALAHAHAIAQELEPAIKNAVTTMLRLALQEAFTKELGEKTQNMDAIGRESP